MKKFLALFLLTFVIYIALHVLANLLFGWHVHFWFVFFGGLGCSLGTAFFNVVLFKNV